MIAIGVMMLGREKPQRVITLHVVHLFCSVNMCLRLPMKLSSAAAVHHDLFLIDLVNVQCMTLIQLFLMVRHTGVKKPLRRNTSLKNWKKGRNIAFYTGGLFCRVFNCRSLYSTGRLGTQRFLWSGPQHRWLASLEKTGSTFQTNNL